MNVLGWVGNAVILAGMIGVAHRRRGAFLLGAVGNLAYVVKGCLTWQHDLVAIEILVITVALYSWWKWGKDVPEVSTH